MKILDPLTGAQLRSMEDHTRHVLRLGKDGRGEKEERRGKKRGGREERRTEKRRGEKG